MELYSSVVGRWRVCLNVIFNIEVKFFFFWELVEIKEYWVCNENKRLMGYIIFLIIGILNL